MRNRIMQVFAMVLYFALFCGCEKDTEEKNILDPSENTFSIVTEEGIGEENNVTIEDVERSPENSKSTQNPSKSEDTTTFPLLNNEIESSTENKETESTIYQPPKETVETTIPTPEKDSNVGPDDEL